MDFNCRICGNTTQNLHYIVREMLFGFRDEFDYFICHECGCLQISEIPKNLDKYYPTDYYSFSAIEIHKTNKLKCLLKRQRTRFNLGEKSIIGCIMAKLFNSTIIPNWIIKAGITVDSKILDVGCGSGKLLVLLQRQGFSSLTGVDPYIDQDYFFEDGVRIFKAQVSDLSESFDFIMLHHSFEHVANPADTFRSLHAKLNPNGMVLLRIPTVSSYAWRKYKTNWVQLDAPRHLHLHSIKSIELLSKDAGFQIESIEFDSSAFQFLGSEQYIKDIPLRDPKSYKNGIVGSIFNDRDFLKFDQKAKLLNKACDGDQACFFLRKIVALPKIRS